MEWGLDMGAVTPEDLEAFIGLFDASDWDQVSIELDDFALHLSKLPEQASPLRSLTVNPVADRTASTPTRSAAPSPQPLADSSPEEVALPAGWLEIRAPHLGTFYRSPKPGAGPYVDVGQRVESDTDVCLLEVMKLFTTLRAGLAGVVRRVCAKDSQMVESGDLLFVLEPVT
jgi:acetyl-CoA carboxylase biotin carboxyl carrier protein